MQLVSDRGVWQGQANCVNCTLRHSVLFAALQAQEFGQIHQPIDLYSLLPGSLLYRAGDRGGRLFTIRSGILKLVRYLPDGTQRIVRLLRATDLAGLEALLGQPYQHDAVVLRATEACSLPASVVQALSQTNAALYQELLQRWQQAWKEADSWLTELCTGSARQRVARLLLRLVRDGEHSECTLFSCEDMGAMLSITTETASRNIADFKRKRLLTERGANRFHLDTANIKRIAQVG